MPNPITPAKHHYRAMFLNNLLAAAPALGTLGGNGDRIILYVGGTNAYPYSIGIADFTQFYSVPFNSVQIACLRLAREASVGLLTAERDNLKYGRLYQVCSALFSFDRV